MVSARYSSTLQTSSLRGWMLVAVLLIGATGTSFALDHQVSLTSQAMVYVLTVVLASYFLQWQHSVGCAVGSVTALNFFFVPPRWTFEVDSREHLIALSTMLLVALVISHLAERLRREAAAAQLNLLRATQLQELTSQLSMATLPEEVAALGQDAFSAAFEGPCVLALQRGDGGLDVPPHLPSDDADGLRGCVRESAVLGPGTGRWPGLDAWYLPLHAKSEVQGAAIVRPALASDRASREHAQALCALLGQALQRLRLTQHMQTAQMEAQRQQLQSTYLAAISHDLRTPLAAVMGAASSLQLLRDKLSASEQTRLLDSIVREASYLSTLTENTLELVRLTNAAPQIKRGWESMEEIVGAVLARVRQRDPTRRIKSRVAAGLPLVKADPVLLTQLIENLLDNALKYSAESIDLTVQLADGHLLLSVKDRGEDIAPDKYASIFDPYSRGDSRGPSGAGLGLALCRAIASAHDSRLTVRRRSGGGNAFTLAMPLETHQPEGEAT